MKPPVTWLLLALALIWALASADTEQSQIGRQGGRMTMPQLAGPKSFNRLLVNDQETITICDCITAPLITINRKTQQPEPALAESWTISNDGLVLTMTLRPGVRFSDGHPFTADDVLFTFQVLFDPKVNAPSASQLKLSNKPVTVEKVDDATVRFRFPAVHAAAERLFDGIAILPKHALERPYTEGKFETAWNLAARPSDVLSLGPFKLKEYVPGQRTVLERNPYYWKKDAKGNRLPYLDGLIFEIVPSRNTQVLKFRNGELDLLRPITAEEGQALKDLEKSGKMKIFNLGPSLINEIFWFNQNDRKNPQTGKPFVDPIKLAWFRQQKFRQALSYAIDRQAIIDLVFLGKATACWGPINKSNRAWFNSKIMTYEHNLPKARTLLQEAGFHYEKNQLKDAAHHTVEFTLITNAGNTLRQKMGTIIQGDLAKIGIKVQFAPIETRLLLSKIQETFDYEACLLALQSGDTDPTAEMAVLLSKGHSHWWNPRQDRPATNWEARIDDLMSRQLNVGNQADRKKLFDEVQQIMSEQQAFIYLVARDLMIAAHHRIGNLKPAVLYDFALWNCEELFIRE
jgi:peptide/nickel transport system substrate-binding protein